MRVWQRGRNGATTKKVIYSMENTRVQKAVTDDLRPEYDIKSLRVRKVGTERTAFAGTSIVTLEPDVAAVFTSAAAVNAALRSLIKQSKDNAPDAASSP